MPDVTPVRVKVVTETEMKEVVRKIVCEQMGVYKQHLNDADDILAMMGGEEMDLLEIFSAVEEELHCVIPEGTRATSVLAVCAFIRTLITITPDPVVEKKSEAVAPAVVEDKPKRRRSPKVVVTTNDAAPGTSAVEFSEDHPDMERAAEQAEAQADAREDR